MSYILDALRRADAQRALGQPPGLHAQSPAVPAPVDDAPVPPRRAAWGVAAVVLVALAALVLAAWWRAAPSPAPTASLVTSTSAAARDAAPTAAAPPVPAAAAVTPPVAAAPAPAEVPVASATRGIASLPPLPSPALAPARSPASVPAPPPADVPGAVTALNELPPAQRAQLPPLVVGGAVDSPQPSARLLVLDGRVLREGETVTRDLVLERIGTRQAVLRWRDQRVRLDF
jgi:general secretion pathway protein B